MGSLHDLLTVTVMDHYLSAKMMYKSNSIEKLTQSTFTEQEVKDFLREEKITFGLVDENIQQFVHHFSLDIFPIEVAKGYDKIDGKDGYIQYAINTNTSIDHSNSKDFRDV